MQRCCRPLFLSNSSCIMSGLTNDLARTAWTTKQKHNTHISHDIQNCSIVDYFPMSHVIFVYTILHQVAVFFQTYSTCNTLNKMSYSTIECCCTVYSRRPSQQTRQDTAHSRTLRHRCQAGRLCSSLGRDRPSLGGRQFQSKTCFP